MTGAAAGRVAVETGEPRTSARRLEGRVRLCFETKLSGGSGVIIVQAVSAGYQPGNQEVLLGKGGNLCRDRPGYHCVVVWVTGSFVSG